MPVVGYLNSQSPDGYTERLRGFRQGLNETGYVERENVTIEYRWAEPQCHDWTERFPLIVGTLKAASSRRAAFSICSVELKGASRLLYLLSTMLRDEGASILQ